MYYRRPLNFRFVWNMQHAPRRRIYDAFVAALQPKPTDSVLDLGATSLPEPLENMFEVYYPHPEKITAAGVEDCAFLETRHPGLKFVRLEPGKPLPFADGQFDVAFSNGVIEHVGSRESQRFFLSELLRVSKRTFVATPNRWFPFELHTRLPLIHWLPPAVFRGLLLMLGIGFYAQEANLNLLTEDDLLSLLPESRRASARLDYNWTFGFRSNLLLSVSR